MSAAFSYTVWAVLGVLALGLWIGSRSSRLTPARPSVILRRLATGPLSRVALVLAWSWAGWHLFAR